MKTIKYFLYVLVFALGSLCVTSCGDDKIGGDGTPDVTTGWSESGDTMTYTMTASYGGIKITGIWTFRFTGDECTSATFATKYPSAAIAREEWDMMSDAEKEDATISGDTITSDETYLFEGYSRDQIRQMIESMPDF